MGVNKFSELVRRFAPQGVSQVSLRKATEQLRTKAVAVDALVFIRIFLHGAVASGEQDVAASVVYRMASFVATFAQMDVTPVFCFDNEEGKQRMQMKAREHARRRASLHRGFEMKSIEEQRLPLLESLSQLVDKLDEGKQEMGTVTDQVLKLSQAKLDEGKQDMGIVADQLSQAKLDEGKQDIGTVTDQLLKLSQAASSIKMKGEGGRIFHETDKMIQALAMNAAKPQSVVDTQFQLQQLIERSKMQHGSLVNRTQLLTSDLKGSVYRLLTRMKVPTVTSVHEGEALCAYLTTKGITGATATEDTDACVFGDGPVWRGVGPATGVYYDKEKRVHTPPATKSSNPFGESSSSEGFFVGVEETAFITESIASTDGLDELIHGGDLGRSLTCLDPIAIREGMNVTKEEFIDLMILCGTDFSATLKRVGPQTAYKLIKEHKSIDAILKTSKYVPNEGFDHIGARAMYMNSTLEMDAFVDLKKVAADIAAFERGRKDILGMKGLSICIEELADCETVPS
ncbi:Elongation of fatty acids protein 2 [Chytriomyces hyalinus]|nr:Elongation of fatty acids protein 2 [Chytriomyces hyalinus]